MQLPQKGLLGQWPPPGARMRKARPAARVLNPRTCTPAAAGRRLQHEHNNGLLVKAAASEVVAHQVAEVRPGEQPAHTLNLTNQNFWDELPGLKNNIQQASFVSLDCEMSGLFVNGRPGSLDNFESRYQAVRSGAGQHMLLQLGISCFRHSGSSWTVHSYNITLYPAGQGLYSPLFGCQSETLEFLSQNGFDLSSWVANGVRFMPLATRTQQLLHMDTAVAKSDAGRVAHQQATADSPPSSPTSTQTPTGKWMKKALADEFGLAVHQAAETLLRDMGSPTTPALPSATSIDWEAHKREALAWLATAQPGSKLSMPAKDGTQAQLLQALLRMALWQRPDLPAFTTTVTSASTTSSSDTWSVNLHTHPAGSPQAIKGQGVQRAKLHKATGPAMILELIQETGVPVVVHNGILDLAFIIHHLRGGPLPPTWQAYKTQIKHWFPGGLYDTKCLAAALTRYKTQHSNTQAAGGEVGSTPGAAPASEPPPLGKLPLLMVYHELYGHTTSNQPISHNDHTDVNAVANSDSQSSIRPEDTRHNGTWPVAITHAPGNAAYEAAAIAAIQACQKTADSSVTTSAAGGVRDGNSVAEGTSDGFRQHEGGDSDSQTGNGSDSHRTAAANGMSGPPDDQLLTHEAGFDAFLTGAVFVKLVAELAEAAVTQQPTHGEDSLIRPTAPQHQHQEQQQQQQEQSVGSDDRPGVDHMRHVEQYKWRVHAPMGVAYYNLAGPDPPPHLPAVFMVSGINPQMPHYEVGKRWAAAGLGSVRVYMLAVNPRMWGADSPGAGEAEETTSRSGGGRGGRQHKGQHKQAGLTVKALVQVNPGAASRVMQSLHLLDRQWAVQPIEQYLSNAGGKS